MLSMALIDLLGSHPLLKEMFGEKLSCEPISLLNVMSVGAKPRSGSVCGSYVCPRIIPRNIIPLIGAVKDIVVSLPQLQRAEFVGLCFESLL